MYKAIKLTADNYVALITKYCFNSTTVEDYKMQFEMNTEFGDVTYLSIQDFLGWNEGEQYNVYLHTNMYGIEPFANTSDMNDTEFVDVISQPRG